MSKLLALKGIVLRTTNYSETSIICDIYTDELGTRGYIVSGVRTANKTKNKGIFFQPAALLDLVVYHHDSTALNRIKEFKWDYLYQNIYFSVWHNAVALFLVELMTRTLRYPDHHPELFDFTRKTLLALDRSEASVFANIPLYFMVHLANHLGFRIDHKELHELSKKIGISHLDFSIMDGFMEMDTIENLSTVSLNRHTRNQLYHLLHAYYREHVHDFGSMKSYAVIREIFQ